jgi:uncharacterized membrane protein YozB (DUF420 family)
MEYRHPMMIIFLSLVTLGIYPLVWLVKTKNEMKRHYGVFIPPAWYLIIPFVNLYWVWHYAKGVETITDGKREAMEAFYLIILFYFLGMSVLQADFNKVPARFHENSAEI